MKVCILGRGKVGKSLHRALHARGVQVQLRSASAARVPKLASDTYVLAVPDARIAEVSARIAPRVARGNVVLHCAGARGPEELSACAARGAHVAGFHPLVSFASPKASFAGATFVVHGDGAAVRRARALAKQLDARVVALPVLGAAYHAACALVANGSAALAHAGVGGLVSLGFSQKQAEQALSGLLHTVADNVASVGVPRALTGPVVRGDADTVARHLEALRQSSPALARSYAQLLPLIVSCALDAGLAKPRARAIEQALKGPRSSRVR